jgi:hypothetical protein
MKPRRNEEAQAHVGLSSHMKRNIYLGGNIHKKLKFILEQAMKAQRGSIVALLFL